MPDKKPLDALKKATGIGPNPMAGELRVAGMPMLPEAGMLSALQEPAAALQKLYEFPAGAEAVMNQMRQASAPVFQAMRDAGSFAGDRTVGALQPMMESVEQTAAPAIQALKQVPRWFTHPRSAYPVQETLGEMSPEFTPVGGEGLYNVGKKLLGR